MKALSILAPLILLALASCRYDGDHPERRSDTASVDTAAAARSTPAPREKRAHAIEASDSLARIINDKTIDWGKPSNGLRLGIAVRDGMVELLHHNVDTLPLRLKLGDVDAATQVVSYPHHGLMLRDANGADRRLGMLGICPECPVLVAELGPGEITKLLIDPNDPAWHADGAPSPGTFQLTARYSVNTAEDGFWAGATGAGPVKYVMR